MIDKNNATRIKLLKLWELLCQETDEDHPMPTNTIIKKLGDLGIPVTRKTLYGDIQTLNDCGYEVLCNRARANEYYVLDRKFDMPELHILMDAVQAAAFITPKKTKELVNKVASIGGSRAGEALKENVVVFNNTKNTNEFIYYSVNEIVSAIKEKKQIVFRYFKYGIHHEKVYHREGQQYQCTPIATIFSEDKYYMLAYDPRHPGFTHYRVDRMDEVEISDTDAAEIPPELQVNLSEYKRSLFGMFAGEETEVTIVLDDTLKDIAYDKFGDKLKMKSYGESKVLFIIGVQVSPVFLAWACAFGDKLQVVAPESVVEKVKEYIKTLASTYTVNEGKDEKNGSSCK